VRETSYKIKWEIMKEGERKKGKYERRNQLVYEKS
jgi:hypothetical protein